MTKFKKGLTFITTTLLSVASISGTVNAADIESIESMPTWYWGEVSSLTLPDGYEEDKVQWDSVSYINNSKFRILRYDDFRYNYVELTVSESTDWSSAYEAYCAELGFDKVVESETFIMLYDTSEEGDDPRVPASVSDKAELIEEMCEKMYKDGVIEAASYTAFSAHYRKGDIDKIIAGSCDLDENALTEIVAEYSEDFSVVVNDGGFRVTLNDVETVDELQEIETSIKSADGVTDTGVLMSFPEGGGGLAAVEPTNLLTAIKEETACDVNSSGTADLDDAVLVLNHYAQLGAGVAASDTDKMDVDGDGEVTLDDAVFVLTVYSELAAGLR